MIPLIFFAAAAAVTCADPGTAQGARLIELGEKPCKVASKPEPVPAASQSVVESIAENMARLSRPLEAPAGAKLPPRLRAAQAADIARVKRYFENELLDGPAARWRFDGVWRDGSICGSVNAKNRLGAYTGWHRFFYKAGDGGIADDSGLLHWSDDRHFACMIKAQ